MQHRSQKLNKDFGAISAQKHKNCSLMTVIYPNVFIKRFPQDAFFASFLSLGSGVTDGEVSNKPKIL